MGWRSSEQHFAPARLQHYLTACNNDRQHAMQLYEWNASLSAAFWESLSYFEVALRNAIDDRMKQTHAAKGRSGHWIFDDAREFGRDVKGPNKHAHPYEDVHTAVRRVRSNNKKLTPGQVISEVSFGFWHQMVSKRQVKFWPDLVAAFPHTPNRSQATVHDPVSRLRDIRNRIGHHHRIWAMNVSDRYTDMLTVAGYIDPDLRAWIDSRSAVQSVLAGRP